MAVPAVTASAAPQDSAQLDAISKVSERAITAASASVDQIKWIFSIASLVISGLIGVLGFLGYQNVRSISAGIREEARVRIDKELAEFNRAVRSAAKLALRTQAAMRQVYVAEKWSESDDTETEPDKRDRGDPRSARLRNRFE
jgi:hypothetical protein